MVNDRIKPLKFDHDKNAIVSEDFSVAEERLIKTIHRKSFVDAHKEDKDYIYLLKYKSANGILK